MEATSWHRKVFPAAKLVTDLETCTRAAGLSSLLGSASRKPEPLQGNTEGPSPGAGSPLGRWLGTHPNGHARVEGSGSQQWGSEQRSNSSWKPLDHPGARGRGQPPHRCGHRRWARHTAGRCQAAARCCPGKGTAFAAAAGTEQAASVVRSPQ